MSFTGVVLYSAMIDCDLLIVAFFIFLVSGVMAIRDHQRRFTHDKCCDFAHQTKNHCPSL